MQTVDEIERATAKSMVERVIKYLKKKGKNLKQRDGMRALGEKPSLRMGVVVAIRTVRSSLKDRVKVVIVDQVEGQSTTTGEVKLGMVGIALSDLRWSAVSRADDHCSHSQTDGLSSRGQTPKFHPQWYVSVARFPVNAVDAQRASREVGRVQRTARLELERVRRARWKRP